MRVERRLQRAHHVERDRVLGLPQQIALQLADAVFGGDRAANSRDDPVHDVVHRLPSRQEGRLVGADRLRDVEMDIAVAEWPNATTRAPGMKRLDRRASPPR